VVLSDVRRTGVIILAIAVCSSGRQHCIKRSGMIRLATSMSRARPSGPASRGGGRSRRSSYRSFCSSSDSPWRYAGTASKWVLSFQIRPKRMASLRATATRARFGPRRFISLRPQLLSADGRLTVVRSTFAAS
jgi:hypothetical protein